MTLLHQLFLDTLRATQWYEPDDIARFQQPQIERMCRHAATTAPGWAKRLRPLFGSGDPDRGAFRFDRWREIPVLTRGDLATNVEAFTANATPEAAGRTRAGATSGSTGTPLAYRASELVDIASLCQSERIYEEHAFDLFAPFASIRLDRDAVYPEGKRSSGWSQSAPSGRFGILHVHTPIERQLDWLEDFGAAHVHAYPSVLARLADAAMEQGRELRFERAMTFSEILTAEARRAAEKAFGCKVVDSYGCNETGLIAWQCPAHENVMHVCAESVLVEVLDEQGELAPRGELGRVVVTSLHNFATPLIRYDIGDLAAIGPACVCGRGLPVLSRIAGRRHNVFVLPDGRRLVAHARDLGIFDYVPIRQFQFVQHTLRDFELIYVPAADGREADAPGMLAHLRRFLHPEVTLVLNPVDAIASKPNGKYETFVSHVSAQGSGVTSG
jgi:phenylacetate-CoA ligase